MHPAKRRRLEQTQSTLNKPFRSPLRTIGNSGNDNHNLSPKPLSSPSLDVTRPAISLRNLPASPNTQISTNQLFSIDHSNTQKRQAFLVNKLNKLKQFLESTDQALQIETSGQDDQLQTLITKWKAIARDAADELFADANERIDQMGGLAAWQRKAQEDKVLWDDEHNSNNTRKYASRHVEQSEENSFTMEMMLTQMNVDLDIIGFDKDLERWVD